MKYVYPAIFCAEEEGGYSVEFPNVPGAITQGETLFEALEMAEDALAIVLCAWEDSKSGKRNPPIKNQITEATPIDKIFLEGGEFATLVKVDTDEYRKNLAVIK